MSRTIIFSLISFVVGALCTAIFFAYTWPTNQPYFSEATDHYMEQGNPNDPAFDATARMNAIEEIADDQTGLSIIVASALTASADPEPAIRERGMDVVTTNLRAYAIAIDNLIREQWMASDNIAMEQRRDALLAAIEPLLGLEPKD